MGQIVVRTYIEAPSARCFDLARDVQVHCRTSAFTRERVVAPGRTAGLLELGDTITFEGRHFGLRWRLTAAIVEMRRPHRFVDEAHGLAFRWMRHVHEFVERDGFTEMTDHLEWRASFGTLGRIVDKLLVERHLRWYIRRKQKALKVLAEQDL